MPPTPSEYAPSAAVAQARAKSKDGKPLIKRVQYGLPDRPAAPVNNEKDEKKAKGKRRKGRVAERAESRRSDSKFFALVRYGTMRTSTVGGFVRLLHPAERHDEVMLDFSAVSTLSPQRNFTATQPTR